MEASEYWKGRFKSFSLDSLMNNFPSSKEKVYFSLEQLKYDIPEYMEEKY